MWVSVILRPIVLWRGGTALIAARRKARRAAAIVVAIVVEVIVIEIIAKAASILVTLVMSIVVKVVVAEIAPKVAVLLVAAMVVKIVKSSVGLSERWHGEGARWHRGLRSRLIKAATVEAWIGHAEAMVRGGRLAEAEYQTYQHR